MKRLLALSLLLAVGTAQADDVECKISWPILGGKVGKPILEIEASDVDFSMSSRSEYRLDIGGSIELHNGSWKINKITKSDKFDPTFEDQWLRGRMARRIPHKDEVVGSIPIVATKQNGQWVITVEPDNGEWFK